MNWKHTLNDTEIDEPTGFASMMIGPVRDDVNHGIGYEATQSSLVFTGSGYDILYNANETQGLRAKVIYAAYSRCDDTVDWDLVFSGRVNFGQLKKVCGNTCTISAPIETDSCEVVLNARYDQQVDMDKYTGVDNTTALQKYDEMGKRITLHAKKVSTGLDIQVDTDGDEILADFALNGVSRLFFRPDYEVIRLNSIKTGHPDSTSYYQYDQDELSFPISPLLLLDDFVKCFDGGFIYNVRIKGTCNIILDAFSSPPVGVQFIKVMLLDWDGATGNIFDNSTVVQTITAHGGIPDMGHSITIPFDGSLSGTYSLPDGHGLYIVLFIQTVVSSLRQAQITIDFDKDTLALITAEKNCPDTDTDYYMVHEALSHVVEEITNGCLKVKSGYYGRVDSQPYGFTENGCGGMRMLTSGLKIRNAANPTFFTSFKFLIDGLRAIDNIGFDVFENTVRIEDVRFFYQDKEIMKCPGATLVNILVDENGHYAKIVAGYKSWKVEQINGLDEFNSEREYKTSVETISTELNIQSGLVSGSYPIEVTREQSFAETGAADTSYDNEIFIICVRKPDYPYSGLEVEQGGISGAENMYSPETAYNWRIRPVANMLRWFKSIASTYRNILDTANQLFFSSGTGNILARGMMADAFCRPEKQVTQENQSIFFTQTDDFAPIWINETITFSYPLSLADYNKIKANPYGYISVQCGEGQWLKGFIKQVNYQPANGNGQFTLKRKY